MLLVPLPSLTPQIQTNSFFQTSRITLTSGDLTMSSDDLESPPSNYLPIPPSDEFHDQPTPLRSWLRLLSIPLALMFLLVLATFLSNLESPPSDSGLVSDPVTFDVNPAVVRRGKDAGVSDKTSGVDSGFVSDPVAVDANSVVVHRGKDAGVSDKTSGVDSGLLKDGPLGPFPWTNQMLSWQRTGFHFQPVKNWMNDPNGPLYYKGWYHFFYQYNPEGAVWGNIAWGHAVSRDLVHWTHLPLAMVPDQWYDINGVWTGSATILPDGQIVMLYTGATNESVQVQNLAVPADQSDTLLLRWKKSEANPILVPPPGIGDKDFRDPTTAWYEPSDDTWRIVIGSKDSSHSGIAIVYSTKDFVNYKLIPGILHAVERVGMWECVDFYPVATADSSQANHGLDPSARPSPAVKHVLKASMDDDRHDYYAIGTYDPAQNTWVPDDASVDVGIGLRYDWGKFYASKTFYDHAKKRRILWSWIGETDSETADIAKGWASLQGVPRTVLLDVKTGSNLITWPVVEIESLRTRPRDFSGITVDAGSTFKLDVGGAAQLDIEAEFTISSEELEAVKEADVSYNCSSSGGAAERGVLGPFGLLVLANQDLTEQTATYFYVSRGMDGGLNTHFCQDEKRSSKASDIVKRIVGYSVPVLDGESFTLRILVDHSIVESFAQGGRASATSRVYPTEAIYNNARVFVFNNATGAKVTAQSLKVWHMSTAINEIYDPATNMM